MSSRTKLVLLLLLLICWPTAGFAEGHRGRLRHPGGLVTNPLTPVPSTCDYYAAPTGSSGNDGQSSITPFRPDDFWALGQTTMRGKTLCLMDGTYTGDAFMVTPTAGIAGSSASTCTNAQGTGNQPCTITVKALNDGRVLIDAQFSSSTGNCSTGTPRRPFKLDSGSNFWIIDGINFRQSCRQVGLLFNASNNIIRKSIFWDADGTQNLGVVVMDGGSADNLFEDAAFFGMGRNIWEVFNGTRNTCRRCWFRTEGQMNNSGPIHAFEPSYGGSATSAQTVCDNCLYTWYAIAMPQNYVDVGAGNVSHSNFEMAGQIASAAFSEENCGENQQHKISGSLSYLRDADTVGTGNPVGVSSPFGLFNLQRANNHTVKDLFVIVRSGYTGSGGIAGISLGNFSCSPAPSGITLTRATTVSPGAFNNLGSGVTQSSVVTATSVGSAPSPWSDAGGANLCWRYQNGTRQDGTKLWPWPMDARIVAAMTQAGSYAGPCNSCSGGLASRAGTANPTADVEALLGTIPATCKG